MPGVNIVDFGKAAQQYGWVVGENPNFGTGRVGGHAPGSYHYSGQAVDITAPTNVDTAPAYPGGKPISWQQRTGELSWRLKQLAKTNPELSEVLGPGDPGHGTHVHTALPKAANLTPQQLQWAFTGRTTDASGKLTDVMPGAAQQSPPINPTASATTGNTVNVYFDGKKETTSTSDFLSEYMDKLGLDTVENKPAFNPLAMLNSAFNAKTNYMT